jgi:branched-chain amino acid transport system ATP-binding protein
MLLEIKNVHVHYHKVAALKGIDMAVPEDGIVTIIGANGAGKTTTLRAISGLVRISQGEILFAGERIDRLPPEKIVALGIAHVPEGRRIFPDLTVEENLGTGAFLRSDKAGIAKDLDEVFHHFPRLKERRKQWARSLSGGEQQMLAIGRALMSRPKMLVLDEPSMGLSPVLVQEIARIVRDIVARGVPVVLVEQNAELALRLARYAYVLETGSIALQGSAHELHDNAQNGLHASIRGGTPRRIASHSAAVFGFHRAAEASSLADASTQRAPPGPISRFQNGALVLR